MRVHAKYLLVVRDIHNVYFIGKFLHMEHANYNDTYRQQFSVELQLNIIFCFLSTSEVCSTPHFLMVHTNVLTQWHLLCKNITWSYIGYFVEHSNKEKVRQGHKGHNHIMWTIHTVCHCTHLLLLQNKCHCICHHKKKGARPLYPSKPWPWAAICVASVKRTGIWQLMAKLLTSTFLFNSRFLKWWKVWIKTSRVEQRKVIEHAWSPYIPLLLMW